MPTPLIGSDAFQECDTVGITRSCTKHNYLVKNVADLPRVLHEAFYIANSRPAGPGAGRYPQGRAVRDGHLLRPRRDRDHAAQELPPRDGEATRRRSSSAVDLMLRAERPVFYTGGGVINSGPEASEKLRELAELTGFPVTSTLMGLGAFPGANPQWLGMLGMHGTYEANMAMHDCDLMINIGARFDDRITGRIDAFSPGSTKIHVDIDPSSINKNVRVDLPIVGDCGLVLEEMVRVWRRKTNAPRTEAIAPWWARDRRLAQAHSLGVQELGHDDQAATCGAAALCRRPRIATSTSPRKSASTRCGRRSTSSSRSRTAG